MGTGIVSTLILMTFRSGKCLQIISVYSIIAFELVGGLESDASLVSMFLFSFLVFELDWGPLI